MSCGEYPHAGDFDAYIRAQLAKAADTYASHVDPSARLELIWVVGNSNQDDGTAAVDS
jgi:hypothetical protein